MEDMILYYIEFDLYTVEHWTRLRITYHTRTAYEESILTLHAAPHVRAINTWKGYVQ